MTEDPHRHSNENRPQYRQAEPDFAAMNRDQLCRWADQHIIKGNEDEAYLGLVHEPKTTDEDVRLLLIQYMKETEQKAPSHPPSEKKPVKRPQKSDIPESITPPVHIPNTPQLRREQIQDELLERAKISQEDATKPLNQKIEERLIELFKEEYSYELPGDDGKKSFGQSNLVKAFHKGAKSLQTYLETNHKEELNRSREDVFPYNWMTNDRQIRAVMQKYPHLVRILNYLNERNRRSSNRRSLGYDDWQSFIEKNESLLGDLKFDGKHEFSTFVTNRDFYKAASEHLGISAVLIRKYLAGMTWLLHWKKGRYRVYADGYFVETTDMGKVKHSLTIDTAEVRKALRSFKVKLN